MKKKILFFSLPPLIAIGTFLFIYGVTSAETTAGATNPSPAHSADNVSTNVTLSWSHNLGQYGNCTLDSSVKYNLYVSTYSDGSSPFISVTNFTDNSYKLSNLENFKFHFWKVDVTDACGNTYTGTLWNFITAIGGPPVAPSDLKLELTSNNYVKVSWKDNSNNEKGFKIERKLVGGSYAAIFADNADSTSFIDEEVEAGNTYYYRVRSYGDTASAYGHSDYSNEVSIAVPVTPIVKPDLVISDISVSPATPKIGETFSFYIMVKNNGNEVAVSTGGISILPPTQDCVLMVYSPDYPPALKVGAETKFIYSYKCSSSPQTYFKFTVDPNNEVDESNENNNSATKTVAITSGISYVKCTDSDGGMSIYNKGTASGYDSYGGSGTNKTYEDTCDGTGRVKEFYCAYQNDPTDGYGYVTMSNEICPNGCSFGACKATSTDVCIDTDGGKDYYKKGTVSARGDSFTDECTANGLNLREGSCNPDTGYYLVQTYGCPNGCSFGACKAAVDLNPKSIAVSCSADNNSAVVKWTNPNTTALELYQVYRSETFGSLGYQVSPEEPNNWLGQDDANKAMSYTDSTITSGKKYYYTIRLKSVSGNYSTDSTQYPIICGSVTVGKPDLTVYDMSFERKASDIADKDSIIFTIYYKNQGNTTATGDITFLATSGSTAEYPSGFKASNTVKRTVASEERLSEKIGGTYLIDKNKSLDASFTFTVDSVDVIIESSEDNNYLVKRVIAPGQVTLCTDEYAPVCSTNNVTYSNKCQLENSGKTPNYYGVCRSECKEIKTTSRNATRDDYWKKIGTDVSREPDILKYRIKWSTGSWSDWYYPGHGDIDQKTNLDGTKRLMWAYFYDHTHEYVKCERNGNKYPDLVIKEVDLSYEPALQQVIGNVRVKNVGESEAYSPYDVVGLWLDINGKEYGWNQLPVSDVTNNLFLKSGISRIFGIQLSSDFFKNGSNEVVFYIDRSYDKDHVYLMPQGYIKESDENNNTYQVKIKIDNLGTVAKPTSEEGKVYQTTEEIVDEGPGLEVKRLRQEIQELKDEIRQLKDEFLKQEKMLANKIDEALSARLKGKILLQVEEKGEAWYVNPVNENKYYLGRPDDAFGIMRQLGLGITNADLEKIDVGLATYGEQNDSDKDGLADGLENGLGTDKNKVDTDGDGYNDYTEVKSGYDPLDSVSSHKRKVDVSLTDKLNGRIVLQVEKKGEAWYINPDDNKRYYLGRPADAFAIMRGKGLGITNNDLRKIEISEAD